MTDVEITYDERWPPHAVFAEADGDTVRVTVSPDVEARALALLDKSIGLAVTEAVTRLRAAPPRRDGTADEPA